METKLIGYVVLKIEFKKEGEMWLATCVETGTSTFGDTLEEAQEAITELLPLHLNTLEEVGERENFFKKHNIKILPKKPTAGTRCDIPLDPNKLTQCISEPIPTYAH